ncbi:MULTISPECIES: hypothetical protein [Dyella]|uniref:Uncharacterized protein n=2 Tax=Dyella TaxID=231454 RepID=A0A4R0YZY6_9GAMM|nr:MULTISPECIES: hypothetical protein [Dyella]TBR39394.1 hypothetical protein EYV96_04020 [Dyella terrae]TCI13019.1 hypothetical protein EZM97_06845 [Dyella soli]
MQSREAKQIVIDVELHHDYKHPDAKGHDDLNMLVINQGKHHHSFAKCGTNDGPHTITWRLTGNASEGEFCGLDEKDNPGFCWLIRQPNGKVFQKLRVNDKTISIENHHHHQDTEGHWHYQLFARVNGQVYGVPLTFACGFAMSTNPSIKNT